jgi:hypothetical protein
VTADTVAQDRTEVTVTGAGLLGITAAAVDEGLVLGSILVIVLLLPPTSSADGKLALELELGEGVGIGEASGIGLAVD